MQRDELHGDRYEIGEGAIVRRSKVLRRFWYIFYVFFLYGMT
jgi:hypothetical protein